MTGAYPTTPPAMNPEPTDLITANSEYRHEGLDPAKVAGSMQGTPLAAAVPISLSCAPLSALSARRRRSPVACGTWGACGFYLFCLRNRILHHRSQGPGPGPPYLLLLRRCF